MIWKGYCFYNFAGFSQEETGGQTPSEISSSELDPVTAFVASLELTRPDILRATKVRHVLWRLGRVFRTQKDCYHRAFQTSSIQRFISHSWHGSKWAKIMLLLVEHNGLAAVALGTLGVLGISVLLRCVLGFMSEDLRAASMLAGLLMSALTLILWQPQQKVFLDRICIHQTNSNMKMEGVLNVPAFIKRSESMLACWDTSYMQRCWCVLEIAAFIKSHGKDKLAMKPVSWGKQVIICFLCTWAAAAIDTIIVPLLWRHVADNYEAFFLVLGGIMMPVITVFLYKAADSFRWNFRQIELVKKQLQSFSFDNDTVCHCCSVNHVDKDGSEMPCDRLVTWIPHVMYFVSFCYFHAFLAECLPRAL